MCHPNHGSGQSELITVLQIAGRAQESNPGLLGGNPAPYLSAIATTPLRYYALMPSNKVKIVMVESIIDLSSSFQPWSLLSLGLPTVSQESVAELYHNFIYLGTHF